MVGTGTSSRPSASDTLPATRTRSRAASADKRRNSRTNRTFSGRSQPPATVLDRRRGSGDRCHRDRGQRGIAPPRSVEERPFLDRVGLAAGCAERGFGFDFFLVSDGAGKLQAKNPLPPAVPGFPGRGRTKRPLFANFMTEAAESQGALDPLSACTVEADWGRYAPFRVRFTDEQLPTTSWSAPTVSFPASASACSVKHEPIYVGQGVYRFMTERDPSIDQLHVFVGPKLKAGFIPLSRDSMYLFTTMSYPPHTRIDESEDASS